MNSLRINRIVGVLAPLCLPALAAAQEPREAESMALRPGDLVTVVAGPQYEASGLRRFLLGDNWRDLWIRPVEAPVLDLDDYWDGETPFERGGRQSKTLHMFDDDGREYIFKTVDKFLENILPPDLVGTVIGDLLEEGTCTIHPGGNFVAGPILDAAGLPHPDPQLYYMPDDPRLGKWRADFGGVLGLMTLKPDEGEAEDLVEYGSNKFISNTNLLDRLENDPRHSVDAEAYLAARLIDMLIGDPDRGGDQWRWARYDAPGARYIWRPIARDHDWALSRADGLLMGLVRSFYPKVSAFGPDKGSMTAFMHASWPLDRRYLVELEKPAWDSVAVWLQETLTDDVLEAAAYHIPDGYHVSSPFLVRSLIARRDQLPLLADELYAAVAGQADVHATDVPERVEVERHRDGSVSVRLYPGRVFLASADGEGLSATDPYFNRRFRPDETSAIRIYLHHEADQVTVTGQAEESITVRVIGDEDEDTLIDDSRVGGKANPTTFHEDRGERRLEDMEQRREEREDRVALVIEGGPAADTLPTERDGQVLTNEGTTQAEWLESKKQEFYDRDWGGSSGLSFLVDHRDGAGLVLGAGPRVTEYGFRQQPYSSRVSLYGLVGLKRPGIGVLGTADFHFVESPLSVSVEAHAWQIGSHRFYGFGNDTPEPLDHDRALVHEDEVLLQAFLNYRFTDDARVSIGPVVRWTDPSAEPGDILDVLQPFGVRDVGRVGGQLEAVFLVDDGRPMPRRGFGVELGASAFPAAWDLDDSFARARGEVFGYVPIPVGRTPSLALRLGGQKAWGTFPVDESALIGGKRALRGYRTGRFRGDAAVYGGAELRVPLARANLILARGELGVFGFGDVGRVYVDGESPGGWHDGVGGGVWFTTVAYALNVAIGHGEQTRFYFSFGPMF